MRAFSHVYRARRGSTNVALKIQNDQPSWKRVSARGGGRRACASSASVALRRSTRSTNLMGGSAIVMEYVEGETLAEHMARGVPGV